ncbi:MAG: hypothetical protein WCQ45_06090, partial [bacterium]
GEDPSGRLRGQLAGEASWAGATDHIGVCEHVGRVLSASDPTVALLPSFSRLADAGMTVMDPVAKTLRSHSHIALADVAAIPEARSASKALLSAAREWLKGVKGELRHIDTANRFASAIPSEQTIECLQALLRYHEEYGGGLRWFVLRNGRVEPRTPPRADSSRYRFRLWSLCRLATQCGILHNMPVALRRDDEIEEGESSEAGDE